MDNKQTKEDRMNRIKGSVIGYAVGDATGALTEFMTPGEIRKKYGKVTEMLPGGWIKGRIAGETTDDTAMMKAVLNSLAASNGVPDYKDMADRLLAWLDTGPKDVGMACRRGLESYRKTGSLCNGDDTTLGNGGLLRVLGFALSGRDWREAMEHVNLTHAASWQGRAVQSYANLIGAALNGDDKKAVVSVVRGAKIRIAGITSNRGEVRATLSSALNWFYTTDTFEDCIVAAVNAGHDSDSVAAIAGSIAGCHYGYESIPERWKQALDRDVHCELLQLAEQLSVMKEPL